MKLSHRFILLVNDNLMFIILIGIAMLVAVAPIAIFTYGSGFVGFFCVFAFAWMMGWIVYGVGFADDLEAKIRREVNE